MKRRIAACCIMILSVVLFASCSTPTTIKMEMTQNYDTSDPFIHATLIYVSDDIETLDLDVSFQMQGERGILEIIDTATEQVVWAETWNGDISRTNFIISLDDLEKEKEYEIRFTGTKIEHAKIVITSDSSLVEEREIPRKPSKS